MKNLNISIPQMGVGPQTSHLQSHAWAFWNVSLQTFYQNIDFQLEKKIAWAESEELSDRSA